MLVPAVIYAAINWGDPVTLRGWAIPAARYRLCMSVAFASRRPRAARAEGLPAHARGDRRPGAITIIALFYADNLSAGSIGIAGPGSPSWRSSTARVQRITPYFCSFGPVGLGTEIRRARHARGRCAGAFHPAAARRGGWSTICIRRSSSYPAALRVCECRGLPPGRVVSALAAAGSAGIFAGLLWARHSAACLRRVLVTRMG